MTSLLLVMSLFCSLLAQVHGQAYIPRPLVRNTCDASLQSFNWGNVNAASFDQATSTTATLAGYVIGTPFTNTLASNTIHQLSFGILDNYQITSVTLLRMAIYKLTGTNQLTLLGQTEEIMLYATGATTIYANLITPVTIQTGSHVIAVWSSAAIRTGINTPPTGRAGTTTIVAYNTNGFTSRLTTSVVHGDLPVAVSGCGTGVDPWVSPTIQYRTFCLSMAHTVAPQLTTNQASTVMVTFNGVVAVDTARGGIDPVLGQWYTVTAGTARYASITYGGTNSAFTTTTSPARDLEVGGNFGFTFNQRLYISNPQGVDYHGISFELPDSTQMIIQYQNGTHEIMVVSPGSSTTYQAVQSQFSSQTSTRDATYPTCSLTTPSYAAEQFTCPAGTTQVKYGDDEIYDAALTTNTATSMVFGNYLIFRSFTALTPGTTMHQLSWLVNANTDVRLRRVRLGLFTNRGSSFTLVQQTPEIRFWSTPAAAQTHLRGNLMQPVTLAVGQNYSIGVVADGPIYTSYAGYMSQRSMITSTFQVLAPSSYGFRSPVTATGTTTTVLPVAATGCTTSPIVKYSFCAVYVYPTYNQIYSGVLTATSETITDEKGTYQSVFDGYGTYNYTYTSSATPPQIFDFAVHKYNLNSNNRLYVSGNGGAKVDQFGLQFVVQQGAGLGLASQHRAVFDVISDSYMYRENTQTQGSATVRFLNPILSTFSTAPYTDGQPIPLCPVPPRPANTISPLSVARLQCATGSNQMADTFGDIDVANFNFYADGTLIQGNRIYSQRFTADSNAVVNQLAVSILQNADRPAAISVRLGFYGSDNTLLGQTNELIINQAVPQLINMNLPSPINVVSGQTYMIAIVASAPLEVAHTGEQSTPSMAFTYSSTGLPTTFVSSGNDVSPSIAAYACVTATHAFCSSFQYVTPERTMYTYLYQGLIQASTATAANSWGVYSNIFAAAGRLITYRRTPSVAANSQQVFTFWQRPNNPAKLYTAPVNGKALDTDGIELQTSTGANSHLQFNLSIGKFDDSFSFASTLVESDLLFSNFTFVPLDGSVGIPSCGLETLPVMEPDRTPLPQCEGLNEVVTLGDGNQFMNTINTPGVNALPGPIIFLRQITTDGGYWILLDRMVFGMNTNFNNVNRFRFGIYDNALKFVAATEEVVVYNTRDYLVTGFFRKPVWLEPGRVYNLAVWTSGFVYAGFSTGSGPGMLAQFEGPEQQWPAQFVNTNPNSQRAIGAFGCTSSVGPVAPSSSSSTGGAFSSSPFMSSSAAASSTAPVAPTSSPLASSSTAPAVQSSTVQATSSPSTAPSSTAMPPVDAGSSTKSGLEKGAVAGVVIGCVIASNLLLAFCMWFCCLGGATAKGTKHKELEESRVENTDREVEMGNV